MLQKHAKLPLETCLLEDAILKQRLTRAEALKAYTIEAAFSGFEETNKGKIASGMLADIIILSDDILILSSKALLDLKVEQAYISGQLKYESK